jgi:hypothetical protein
VNGIVLTSKVLGDGTVPVTLPAGTSLAGTEVRVTVEPAGRSTMSPAEWRRGILETAGKWLGEFVRPDQGEFERRTPLS